MLRKPVGIFKPWFEPYNMSDTRGSNSEQLATAKRRREVLRLRRAGATYTDVAETLRERHGTDALPNGWDRAYAAKDVSRELQKLRSVNTETAEDLRALEVERLDEMLNGVWTNATGGDTDAVSAALRIQKRRAKLLGLDAAERVEIDQNVNVRAEIVELRAVIMGALDGFPEARQAVADALAEHGQRQALEEGR
jgi:hypothetical protein